MIILHFHLQLQFKYELFHNTELHIRTEKVIIFLVSCSKLVKTEQQSLKTCNKDLDVHELNGG